MVILRYWIYSTEKRTDAIIRSYRIENNTMYLILKAIIVPRIQLYMLRAYIVIYCLPAA